MKSIDDLTEQEWEDITLLAIFKHGPGSIDQITTFIQANFESLFTKLKKKMKMNPDKKTINALITGEWGAGMSYSAIDLGFHARAQMDEKGCWNCKWENLASEIEPCSSCSLFDKWEA